MRAELTRAIEASWIANKPLTFDSALSLAMAVLADYPKERSGFRDWYQTHGEEVIRRVNG